MDADRNTSQCKHKADHAETNLLVANTASRYYKYADDDVPDEESGLNEVDSRSQASQNKDVKKAAISLLLGYKLMISEAN